MKIGAIEKATHPRDTHISGDVSTNSIPCPCGGNLVKTVDSRPAVIGELSMRVVRRRRVCDQCGQRHVTVEMSEAALAGYHRKILKELAVKLIMGLDQ